MSFFTKHKSLVEHAAFAAGDTGLAALIGFLSGPHVADFVGGGNAVWVAAAILPIVSTLRKWVQKRKQETTPPTPPAPPK